MSADSSGLAPHVLHILPSGQSAALIGAFGTKLRHTLVTPDGALPEGLRASAYLKTANNFPSLAGLPLPGRMQKLARAMTPFDLVLTHGWEAMDVAMAHTLFKDAMHLPPLIHHEYAPDDSQHFRRKWYRRLALGKSAGLVVPGERLEEAALVDWQQPLGRVKRIAPGIDTKAFAKQPKRDGFRLIKRASEKWLGVWPEQFDPDALGVIARAFDRLSDNWQLVVMGERGESQELDALLHRLLLSDRVHFPGELADPAKVIGLFDMFLVAREGAGFPVRAAQAMAASLPVLAPADGEVSQLTAPENASWHFDRFDDELLGPLVHALSQDKAERERIGEANRAMAVKLYDRDKTLATFKRLYSSAMKREF